MTLLTDPDVFLEIYLLPAEKPHRCTLRMIGGGGEAHGCFGTATEAYHWAEETLREWRAAEKERAAGKDAH
jgi:hypothetical protein